MLTTNLLIFQIYDENHSSDNNSSQIISMVICSLPSLPSHPKISRTALLLCGAYSEWLRNHPDQLFPAVKVLLSSVNDVGAIGTLLFTD